jgi:rod shape-determining protein MreD
MRLPFRRRRIRASNSQGARIPTGLSFRSPRRKPPKRASSPLRKLSFRRRRRAAPASKPTAGALSGLSFRRRDRARTARPAAADHVHVRDPRTLAVAAAVRDAVRKLRLRRHRPDADVRPPPRREPDALGLALRLVALGLLAGLLQLTIVSQIEVLGVSANVTPLVVAAAGFLCGSLAGAAFGFGVGLFVDLAFVQTLGISSLLFTLIGYGAGRLQELRAPAAPLTRLWVGAAATATALAGYGAIEFMLGVNTPVSYGLIDAIIKTTLLNSLIAVPVYALTRRALLGALPDSERTTQHAPPTTGGLSPLSRA